MSGSITDSDAGGNDWDDTWTPQQGASYQISNFVWKPLWRKFQIKVHFLDGTTTDHVSACLVPCKMQFFIQHHLQRLQKVIKAIKIIDVESINSSNELLEIKIKSQSQDDIFHQIETAISNESEDIIMKTVLKHAFTEKLLEEICFQQLRETNIDLMSDDTKVCIVGFSEMKEFINKAVTEIDRATVKRVIKWKDKWKMAAALKFKLIETISNTFGNNLIIGNQEEKCSVYIHGREEAVEKARKELDKLISALFVEKIEVNVHLLQLLAFPEASVVFTDILESKHLSVVWVIDEEQISFVSQSELDRSIIRSKIYENFHEVSFVDSVQNQREFVRSKAFIDFTNVYINKLLLTVNTSTGIIVVSTKAIIHELLHLEKMVYIIPSNTKETQVNIADERYIRLKKEYKTLENNLKHVESNWKQETTVRINAEKNLRQSEERWRSEKQWYIDQEKQFKDEQSDLKQEIEQLNYKCKQEKIEKEAKEHELVKIRERLTKMENDFQREKQWYIDLEIQLKREQLDSKQEIEKLKYKCKEAIDDNENKEQELLKTRERLAKLEEFKSSYTDPRNNQEDAGTQDMNDITRIMISPKSGLSLDVQSEEDKKGSGNDPQITAPLDKDKQKDYINEVTEVNDILYGTINPDFRSKADYISYNKEVVSGTFEQLTKLNRKLFDKFGVETGVFDLDKKANNLPLNVKGQQTQNDYEHIVRIGLSYMEYKMMKFFYPNDPIFKANSHYENGNLCTLPDVGENGQTIEDDAKKKLAHLNLFAEFEVVATEGNTIDDDKLGEVYRDIREISDQIFVFRSKDKKVLKLRGGNYEKLQYAKTKIEFLLGVKQEGRGGRRDRVITTEANYNSKKDEKMDTSISSYSRSFSTGSSGSSSSKPPPDMSFKTSQGIIIKVHVGNILQLNVECIVNAANERLSHDAGVAEVISRAAGYSFQQECDDYIKNYGYLNVTECCTTSGGNLKYKFVIHVVGPKWYDYPTDKRLCAKDLKKTIENSFYEAETINVSTIALPAVSSGIFGVPRDVCCSQYCQAVIEYSNKSGRKTCLKEIHFIDKDAEIIKMIQKEFATQLNMISNPSSGSDPSVPSSHASGSRINDEKGLLQRSLSSDASTNPDKNSSGQKRDFSSTVQKSSSSKFIKQYKTDNLKVNIVEEDITKMNVDVIVCPQDDLCQGKGGIAKAIENISDSVYRTKVFAMKKINKCEVRRYLASPNLPFKHVLHTVPPKWDNHASKDNKKFMQDLDLTIRNIIRHCSDSQDIKTVAIPILGVGYGLPTPYATCAGTLSDVISTEAQRDKFKIEEVYIVTHEKGMAIAVADTFDKESIFKSLTTFQRHNKKQQNRQDGKLSASGTGDEMKGRNNKSDETTYSNKSDNGKLGSTVRGENLEDCTICLSTPSDPRKLKCGHIFCEGCIGQQFKFKPVCPNCGSIQGVITGDQPPGKISVCTMPKLHLPGYPECGRIDIFYEIYPGKQGPEHPEPGKRYEGIRRTAYLPDNERGRKIAKMLGLAFHRKLIFTIGHSRTTGKEGMVTWNDIHHKTSPNIDSQFGYPDPTYFDRVVEELAAKGITEKDI